MECTALSWGTPPPYAEALTRYCEDAGLLCDAPRSISFGTNVQSATDTGLRVHLQYEHDAALGGSADVDATLSLPLRHVEWRRLFADLEAGKSLRDRKVEESSTDIVPQYRNAKVLVADDNDVNREVATEALRHFGIEATLVNDGLEAVTRSKRRASISCSWMGACLDSTASRRPCASEQWTVARRGAHACRRPDSACRRFGRRCLARGRHGRRTSQPFNLKSLAAILSEHLGAVGSAVSAPTQPVAPAPPSEPVAAASSSFEISPCSTRKCERSLSGWPRVGGETSFTRSVRSISRMRQRACNRCKARTTPRQRRDRPCGARAQIHELEVPPSRVAAIAAAIEGCARDGKNCAELVPLARPRFRKP